MAANNRDLLLRGELTPEHLAHLGLKGPAPRHLSEIRAKTVILVAFSMYCPHCQREAPVLNEMNRLIAELGLAGHGPERLLEIRVGRVHHEIALDEVVGAQFGIAHHVAQKRRTAQPAAAMKIAESHA